AGVAAGVRTRAAKAFAPVDALRARRARGCARPAHRGGGSRARAAARDQGLRAGAAAVGALVIVAFLGPSLPAREARGFRVLPPARQGDVWRALGLRPRAIALIDGVFEAQPSIWHREILDALDAGVPVVGGASMGALRAAELRTLGMTGVGRIFRWYRDGAVIDDAEVALLH